MYGFKVRLSKMWRTEVKNMEKKTLLIIGLIGGIVAAVGVFLPWSNIIISVSGWDMRVLVSYPYVVLLGGILALIGGLLALMTKIKGVEYLVPVGGIIAVLGWVWAVADAGTLSGFSYGFYACLVGGILSLIGLLGVKK
jgi:hypothetical protein